MTAATTADGEDGGVARAVDEFMRGLKELYADFFLLARSPLDDKYYEICNVSPSVHAGGDYVAAHLTRTSSETIKRLSERLGTGRPFRMRVRWGSAGTEKDLYCIPLYGQLSISWICMLVATHMAPLW